LKYINFNEFLDVLLLRWRLGMLQSGIRAIGSTLDPYGPRTGATWVKFVAIDFPMEKLGENGRKS
jgi:hypothetical protein